MNGTSGDAKFTMCARWFFDNGQEFIQSKSVNRTESYASSTSVTAIVIDDKQVTLASSHIEKGGGRVASIFTYPLFSTGRGNKREQK